MGLRDQVKTLLWQHGVENDAVLDALDWKMRKIMDENARLREALNLPPAKAALRAYAEASKGVRCPICNGTESCDHTVRERLLADLGVAKEGQ